MMKKCNDCNEYTCGAQGSDNISEICNDSTNVTTFQTGAVRDTGGKGRMDLLPWCALIRISKHMEDAIRPDPETGIPHYPERNWEKGIPMHSMIDSAFRHLAKYMDGKTDEDHLCAAATNLLMAMWTEENRQSMQDIPTRMYPHYEDIFPAKGKVSSSASGSTSRTTIPPTKEVQENAKEKSFVICDYFVAENNMNICRGTREKEQCSCNGDRSSAWCYYQDKE